MPTRWNIVPTEENSGGNSSGYREDYREFLPTIDSDSVAEVRLVLIQTRLPLTQFIQARERITRSEAMVRVGSGTGSQSC